MRKSYCENFTRFQCVVLEKTELKLSTVFLYRNDLRKGIIYIYIYIYNIYIYIYELCLGFLQVFEDWVIEGLEEMEI